MKYSIPVNWNGSKELEGSLFFAQLCEEMLFHYAIEKHRVPIFNTKMIINEYCETIELVENKIINENHEKIIYEEFELALKNDLIIKEYWGKDKVELFIKRWGSLSYTEKKNNMIYLKNHFHDFKYFNWASTLIKKHIKNGKDKQIIESLAKCLISEIIGLGYTAEYVYFICREVFFKSPIDENSINTFLSKFDFKNKDYTVYFAVSKDIMIMRNVLEKRLKIVFEDDGNFCELRRKNNVVVLMKTVSKLDPHSATKKVYADINLLFRFYSFYRDKKRPYIQTKCMVINKELEQTSYIDFQDKNFDIICNSSEEEALFLSEESITRFMKKPREEFLKLLKVLELHNSANEISEKRNAFLNLWSILEVIITDGEGQIKKIDKISKVLLNVLKNDYMIDYISDLNNSIKSCLGSNFDILLQKIKIADNDDEKLVALLYLDEFSELKTELYVLLQNYPLLKNRVYKLSKDDSNFKTIEDKISLYCQKVNWHIFRIYRMRNLIVHSGNSPMFLKQLGEQLHYYVDKLIMVVIDSFLVEGVDTIKNALINIEFSEELYEIKIEKETSINNKNFKSILYRK